MTQPTSETAIAESRSERSPERFVFDACALIAFLNGEDGAEKVERLIEQAQAGEIEIFIASVNLYEVYYDSVRRSSANKAEEVLNDLYEMPVTVVETIDRAIMRPASHFKTAFKLSLADSIALGLAKQLGAQVVSTDHHEFDVVEKSGEITFFWPR